MPLVEVIHPEGAFSGVHVSFVGVLDWCRLAQ